MKRPGGHASAAARIATFLLLTVAVGGCGRQILGFGNSKDGILLVRHNESEPLEIVANETVLGIAQPGGFTCFQHTPTGTLRVEARITNGDRLVRAASIMLPPDEPLLWDVDHDQVLSGRAHRGLCDDTHA
ncbi:MAG: hypothetical protein P8Y29_01615 [Gemmatimonadota bacterium]